MKIDSLGQIVHLAKFHYASEAARRIEEQLSLNSTALLHAQLEGVRELGRMIQAELDARMPRTERVEQHGVPPFVQPNPANPMQCGEPKP